MKNSKLPFASVIILNYFGEKVIEKAINSLVRLSYPKDSFEILVVDNGSTDKSLEILEQLQTNVANLKLIKNNQNEGFSRGNNIGIKHSRGDYVVLLNNDCIVDPDWLSELIKTALADPKIFAVNSKILLYPKYFKLKLEIDPRLILQYSWLSKSNIQKFSSKKIYLNFAKTEEGYESEILFDSSEDSEIEVSLVFNYGSGIKLGDLKKLIKFNSPGVEIKETSSSKNEVNYAITINLKSPALKKQAFSKIQNAGILPFQDGYARDIGGIVKESQQYYEHDNGQYDKEVEVYAACGAAILLNKHFLEKIDALDETFFMYYEDVEISERARLNGYKIYYSPKAIVRHIHALSSNEGSNFFVYHVEKGRLLHVFYNFPFKIFIEDYLKLLFIVINGVAKALLRFKTLRSLSKKTPNEKPTYQVKIQKIYVLFFFFSKFPWLLYLKSRKNSLLKEDAIKNNYNEILSGRWYF